jgi:hypothetical protein
MLCEGALRQCAERKAGAREKHAAGDDSATVEVEAEPALEIHRENSWVVNFWTAFAYRHTFALADNMGPATD